MRLLVGMLVQFTDVENPEIIKQLSPGEGTLPASVDVPRTQSLLRKE